MEKAQQISRCADMISRASNLLRQAKSVKPGDKFTNIGIRDLEVLFFFYTGEKTAEQIVTALSYPFTSAHLLCRRACARGLLEPLSGKELEKRMASILPQRRPLVYRLTRKGRAFVEKLADVSAREAEEQ